MSLLSFTKCFIGAGGEQAATALTTAMVNMDPETATAAELKDMEQDLDAAGQLISRLQRELADERPAYDAINARYTQMMGTAENLQHQNRCRELFEGSLAGIVGDPGRADRRNRPRTRPGQEGHRLHPSPVDRSRGCLSGEGNCADWRKGPADPCEERHVPCYAGGTTSRVACRNCPRSRRAQQWQW